MPTVRIFIDDQEVDPCEHTQTIYEKLASCERELGRPLRAAAVARLSKTQQNDSIPPPPRRSDESARSPRTSRNLGTVGDFDDPRFIAAVEETRRQLRPFEDSEDPLLHGDLDTIEDPFFGPNRFQSEIQVVDAKGKTSTQRKVPFDLDLLSILEKEGDDSIFSDAVIGLSRGVASLMGLGNTTVSEALARASGGNTKNVHVALGLPVIGLLPGDALRDTLIRESDVSLLEGDETSLRRSVKVGELFEQGAKGKAKEVLDRNRGNLEILRLQRLED